MPKHRIRDFTEDHPAIVGIASALAALILVLLLFMAPAQAQTVTTTLNLSWTATTKNTDGSSIPTGNAVTYALFQGPSGGPFTQVGTAAAGTSATVTSIAGGNCFAVMALEQEGSGSVPSALSNTVCALLPGAPGSLAVTVTWTVK